jgi:hypothetical protein
MWSHSLTLCGAYTFVCMYMCIYVHVHVCVCVCVTCVGTFGPTACVDVGIYICTYVYVYMCVYEYMYMCTCVYMYVCISISLYLIYTSEKRRSASSFPGTAVALQNLQMTVPVGRGGNVKSSERKGVKEGNRGAPDSISIIMPPPPPPSLK